MTTRFKRGAITVVSLAVAFASISALSWMTFVTNSVLNDAKDIVGVQKDVSSLTASLGDLKTDIRRLSDTSEASKAYGEWIITNLGENPEYVLRTMTRQAR